MFRAKHVKEALAALDELHSLFQQSFFPDLGFDDIKQQLRTFIIKHPDNVRKALEANGARNACLMGIVRIARDDLASGRDHIYRGTLSMAGDGKKAVFDIAMRELEKAGICTTEVRQLRSQELEEDIREVG
jgi:hypothetical protein